MRSADLLLPNLSQWTRRGVVHVGTLGLTGVSLAKTLQTAEVHGIESGAVKSTAARAKACLLIYLDGGPSHIDLFDLKPDAPAEIRGPYRPIATSVPELTIGELLPRVAQLAHRLVQVRSVCHDEGVHDPAVYQMLTGYKHISSAGGLRVEPTDLPHIGGALLRADRSPASMPKAIQLPEIMKMEARVLPGQNGGILGPSFDPFLVEVSMSGIVQKPQLRRADGVSMDRLRRRSALLREFDAEMPSRRQVAIERHDEYQQQALSILESSAVQQAFDIEAESAATHEKYGRHRHGQSVLLARRLVEAGAKFVTVYWGHEDQDWATDAGRDRRTIRGTRIAIIFRCSASRSPRERIKRWPRCWRISRCAGCSTKHWWFGWVISAALRESRNHGPAAIIGRERTRFCWLVPACVAARCSVRPIGTPPKSSPIRCRPAISPRRCSMPSESIRSSSWRIPVVNCIACRRGSRSWVGQAFQPDSNRQITSVVDRVSPERLTYFVSNTACYDLRSEVTL